MKVIIANNSGFCYGVSRVVKLAKKYAESRDGPVYSLGPIIHNKYVVDELSRSGLKVINSLSEAETGSTVIIRSHGVSPDVLKEGDRLNINIVDATCPFVIKAQRIANDIANSGAQPVVVGSIEHPEVQGITGWAGGKAVVVQHPQEALEKHYSGAVGVLAQTTQTKANFEAVVNILKDKCQQVDVYNTICKATGLRQKSTVELTRKVDVMIVVGGRDSSNTTKLAMLSASEGTPTYQVESAVELQVQWFKDKKIAGLTAGASTPQWIIEEVERQMKEMGEMSTDEVKDDEIKEIETKEIQTENSVAEIELAELANETGMDNAVDIKSVHPGDIVTGVVVQVNQDEVLVDIGAKSEGVIPIRELSCYEVSSPDDLVKVGDKIEVFVIKTEDNEGRLILSKEKADAENSWVVLEEKMESAELLEGTVKEVIKGGLLVDVGVRAFLPASLVDRGYVEDLTKLLGQKIPVKVIEINRARKKVVLSRKAVLEEEYAKNREEIFNNIKEKDIVHGTVKRLTNFGAFVDIGGIDGLLHVSEMAWYRVNHPSEIVTVGDNIEVMILRIDKENEKISLGLKQVLKNPWDNVTEKYPIDTIIQAKVVRIAPFGAFVQLEKGVEGLVHISHLANRHVSKPDEVVNEGDEVTVKVLNVDQDEKRIRLSMREALKEKEIRPPKTSETPKFHESDDGGNLTIGDLVGDIFNHK